MGGGVCRVSRTGGPIRSVLTTDSWEGRTMAMSKKNYESAAAMVQVVQREHGQQVAEVVRDTFAEFFGCDNGRFDRERFMTACIPGANVRARG